MARLECHVGGPELYNALVLEEPRNLPILGFRFQQFSLELLRSHDSLQMNEGRKEQVSCLHCYPEGWHLE